MFSSYTNVAVGLVAAVIAANYEYGSANVFPVVSEFGFPVDRFRSTSIKSTAVQSSTIESAAIESTTVQSAALQPTTVESAAVQSTAVESATVESTAIESATVQSATVQSAAIESAAMKEQSFNLVGPKAKSHHFLGMLRLGFRGTASSRDYGLRLLSSSFFTAILFVAALPWPGESPAWFS